MPLSIANQDRVLPETVALYCAKHQLLPDLQTAIRLAELHFHPVSDLHVGVETNPDADEKSAEGELLVIDVAVGMDAGDVLRRKQAFTRDWVDSAPAARRERIRLLYHIL